MYFYLFFDAGHLLCWYVNNLHYFTRVDFCIRFLDLRYVPRFAHAAVLTFTKEFILEDYVVINDSGIVLRFAKLLRLMSRHTR